MGAACTWAFDVDPEDCTITELKQRLEDLACSTSDRMRLVFNGFTLAAPNLLSEYDIQGGDSLYLYTLKDSNETTVVCCSSEEGPHAPPPICCCCTSGLQPPPIPVCVSSPGCMLRQRQHSGPVCGAAAAWGPPPPTCCCNRGGSCNVSQALMVRPYSCHVQRCICGACVATSVSPVRGHCSPEMMR